MHGVGTRDGELLAGGATGLEPIEASRKVSVVTASFPALWDPSFLD